MTLSKIKSSFLSLELFFSIFLHLCPANTTGKYQASLVLILFYFLYNFKYIKVYFHRPQEMGRSHRTISLPTKKMLHILVFVLEGKTEIYISNAVQDSYIRPKSSLQWRF